MNFRLQDRDFPWHMLADPLYTVYRHLAAKTGKSVSKPARLCSRRAPFLWFLKTFGHVLGHYGKLCMSSNGFSALFGSASTHATFQTLNPRKRRLCSTQTTTFLVIFHISLSRMRNTSFKEGPENHLKSEILCSICWVKTQNFTLAYPKFCPDSKKNTRSHENECASQDTTKAKIYS